MAAFTVRPYLKWKRREEEWKKNELRAGPAKAYQKIAWDTIQKLFWKTRIFYNREILSYFGVEFYNAYK